MYQSPTILGRTMFEYMIRLEGMSALRLGSLCALAYFCRFPRNQYVALSAFGSTHMPRAKATSPGSVTAT